MEAAILGLENEVVNILGKVGAGNSFRTHLCAEKAAFSGGCKPGIGPGTGKEKVRKRALLQRALSRLARMRRQKAIRNAKDLRVARFLKFLRDPQVETGLEVRPGLLEDIVIRLVKKILIAGRDT